MTELAKPIQLTATGEKLEFSAKEDAPLAPFSCIGFHGFCGGKIILHGVSLTHNVIICATCLLRLSIPKEINAYSKLRQFCADTIIHLGS